MPRPRRDSGFEGLPDRYDAAAINAELQTVVSNLQRDRQAIAPEPAPRGRVLHVWQDTDFDHITEDRSFDSADLVVVDATVGPVTIPLPDPQASVGLIIRAKKVDATANAVAFDTRGRGLIDGATTQTVTTQYDTLKAICDGYDWHLI